MLTEVLSCTEMALFNFLHGVGTSFQFGLMNVINL
jgi:hypothetical protein